MLLKENEAKFKNCPFLTTPDGKFKFCLGRQCMMWRFRSEVDQEHEGPGYCGLAGVPFGS